MVMTFQGALMWNQMQQERPVFELGLIIPLLELIIGMLSTQVSHKLKNKNTMIQNWKCFY